MTAAGFTVVTRLAPWPQTIRLTATDVSGNTSIGEFSVVGGVDYRQFPWAVISATLSSAVVGAARGLAGGGSERRGGVEATAWSMGIAGRCVDAGDRGAAAGPSGLARR